MIRSPKRIQRGSKVEKTQILAVFFPFCPLNMRIWRKIPQEKLYAKLPKKWYHSLFTECNSTAPTMVRKLATTRLYLIFTWQRSRRVVMCLVVVYVRSFVHSFLPSLIESPVFNIFWPNLKYRKKKVPRRF